MPLSVTPPPLKSSSFAVPVTPDWGSLNFPTTPVFPTWEVVSPLFVAEAEATSVDWSSDEGAQRTGVLTRTKVALPADDEAAVDAGFAINPIAWPSVASGTAAVHAFLVPITTKMLSDIEDYLVSPEFNLTGLDYQMRAFLLVAANAYSEAALQRLIDATLLKHLPQMLERATSFDAVAGVCASIRSVRAADVMRDFVFACHDRFFAKAADRKEDRLSAQDKEAARHFWGSGADVSDPVAFLHSVCGIVSDRAHFGEKVVRQTSGEGATQRFQLECQKRINRDFEKGLHAVLGALRGEKFAPESEAWGNFASLLPYLREGVLDESTGREYVAAFAAILGEQNPADAVLTSRLFTTWLKATGGAYAASLAKHVARHLSSVELSPEALAVLFAQEAAYQKPRPEGALAESVFDALFVRESQKWDRFDEAGRKVAYLEFYRSLYVSWLETTHLRGIFVLPTALSPRRNGQLIVDADSLFEGKTLQAIASAAEGNKTSSADFGAQYKNATDKNIVKAARVQDLLHLLVDHSWTHSASDMIRLVNVVLEADVNLYSGLYAGFPTWLNRFGFEREDYVAFNRSKLIRRSDNSSYSEEYVQSFARRQLPPNAALNNVFWSLLYSRDRTATLGQEFIKDPNRGIMASGALADMMRAVLPEYFSSLFGKKDADSRSHKNIFYSRRILKEMAVPSVRDELKESISESGPLLRKFLQNYLETMASPELRGYLDDVYENLPTFEWWQYKATLGSLVGTTFERAFPRFDEPKKAGSVAQTHFAVYKDADGDEQDVVVKLRRPNYFDDIDAEKAVLTEKFKPYAFGPKLLDRVVGITKREGDFRNEARGMLELRALYKYARVVKPIAYGEDALIMEKATGQSLRDWQDKTDETPAAIKVRFEALSKTFEEWMESALFSEDGAFHGDPHAGNLFYDPSNARPFQYIDFGNWHALKPKQRELIVAFAKAFAGRDEAGVLAAIAEQCGLKALEDKDIAVLTAKMRELWERGEMSTEELLETVLLQGLDLSPYAISFQRGITAFQNNLMAIQKKYVAQTQGILTDEDVAFFKGNSPVARQIGIFARHFSLTDLMALAMSNPALMEFIPM